HLAGTNGSTSVVLSGWAQLEEFDQQLAVRIQAGSLRLDSALLRALPAGARKSVRQYGLTGRCDLSGWIYLPPSRRELRYDMLAHIADGAMKPAGLAYPIKALGGWLQVRPGRVDILQLTGRGGDGEIAVDGSVRLTDGQGRADLSVHCRGLLLDEPLRAALPGRLQHVWDQLQPRGRINAFLRSQDRPDGRTWQASIELLDARLCYRKFPLPLEQVQGQVKLTARRAQLRRLQARCGQGRVWLDGTIESGPPLRANLQVRAEGMAFDEPLRRALPARFRRAWTAMRPTGRFDLSLARLGCSAEPDGAARWDYRGWLRLRDAGLELGFGLSGVDGVIVAAGQGGPGGRGLSLDGRAEVKRLTINGRVVTELCARLRKASGSDLLRITDVSGRSYGGTVEGFAEVRFGRTEPEYGLSAVLRDVGLGPLLRTRPAGGEGGEDIGGSVTGNIFLTGLAGAAGSRRGGGELQIRRSQLQRLPLVATFLDVANLTAPRGGAFDEADVRFFVQDGRLRFERIDLRGQGLWLAGIGSMRLSDRQLDLRILAARPAGLGRLPLLGELVERYGLEVVTAYM
ncbi:MAG: hypothetical protein ACE5K7_07590, partial [Phycisphaerae bacterium]